MLVYYSAVRFCNSSNWIHLRHWVPTFAICHHWKRAAQWEKDHKRYDKKQGIKSATVQRYLEPVNFSDLPWRCGHLHTLYRRSHCSLSFHLFKSGSL